MQKTNTRRLRRLAGATAAVALVATGAIAAQTFASGAEGGTEPPPPPGQPIVLDGPDNNVVVENGDNNLITTGGSTFDSTILTKFIPAAAFDPYQGDAALSEADVMTYNGNGCISPRSGVAGSGLVLEMAAPVELPDGARIKLVTFYGIDDSTSNIQVRLTREAFSSGLAIFPFTPTYSRAGATVTSFATSVDSATPTVVSSTDNLNEIVGSFSSSSPLITFTSRFHSVEVQMTNSAGLDHVLCGVEVQYQVAASSADPGTVFHPVESFRAFDSRQASFGALSGRLTPNSTKVVDVTDGYDSNGVAIPAQANLVPSNATSITYNITVAGQTGPNFVAVTAGDAASFTASAINYPGSGSLANAGTVTVAADQTIKLWGGDNTGSAHVIIDVTGYYAPAPPPPNMGN